MPKTIRLDPFRYITNEGWRALIAIEMGLKNHEVVPPELAQKISRCKRSGAGFIKIIRDQLIPNSLVAYEGDSKRSITGYRLTNLGYDYLALHQLFKSGQLANLGSMIGTGKESDVYLGVAGELAGLQPEDTGSGQTTDVMRLIDPGSSVVVKFHRLGRTSFRKVKEKREYHQHRNTCSWLYLDRLASQREYSMMKALYDHGIPVPIPLAHNRNAVVMSYVANSTPMARVLPSVLRADDGLLARHLYTQARDILHKTSSIGLIHGDFNEFNLMVVGLRDLDIDNLESEKVQGVKLVLIDFPQMISRDHETAESIYERDADGIVSFFGRFFDIQESDLPMNLSDIKRIADIDVQVKAPGYLSKKTSCQGKRLTAKEILLGATSRRQLGSSDEEDENESEGEGENEIAEDRLASTNDDESEDSTDDKEGTSDEDNSSSEEDENSRPSDESNANCNQDGNVSQSDVKKLSKKLKHINVDGDKSTTSIITVAEIRARHRRERRQQEQVRFQQRVKRSARANLKRQGRASLKAELTLFG